MSRRFDGKRLRSGIVAKRLKGISVFDSQRFQRARDGNIPLKRRARVCSSREARAKGIPKRADD